MRSGGVGEHHERPFGHTPSTQAEVFGQDRDRNGLSLDPDDGATLGVGDCRRIIGLGQHDSMEWQRKALPACLDQQAAQYGGGDRHDDSELGAGAGLRSHLDPAVRGLDVGPDDVEPDASTGHVGDERRGRQARLKRQAEKLLLGHSVGVDAATVRLLVTLATSMPRPSSVTAMITSEPSCIASSRTVACASFPTRWRISGSSMP